ncbi:uncharacterized protein V1518DRAFT_371494 [Limtongia smithiae]|uniref:uncharacterized protein n=1 Tax=Limtongia smithiae TaxID=1125753 RepID=UPI0034CF452D
MSSLSESDIHGESDSKRLYPYSAPISPHTNESPATVFPVPNTSMSPASSSSSLSNYKSFSKLRKKVASAFFSNGLPSLYRKDEITRRPHSANEALEHHASRSRSNSNTPVGLSPSNSAHPLSRSQSTQSNSSSLLSPPAAHPSSALDPRRPRSQTLSSIENDRAGRNDIHQINHITSLTNLLSLRLRTSSDQNFAELRRNIVQNSQHPLPSPPTEPVPIALHDRQLPDRDDNESVADYLNRVEGLVSRNYTASLLSKHDDSFFATALRLFCAKFNFHDEPIDMSLRKFLLLVHLPRESQQIDRILNAFSQRYYNCNPEIFVNQEEAYFIAFSLMILHTDAFNKSNKRRMQKSEYVFNTRGRGVADEVLECFFDNITLTPFINAEEGAETEQNSDKQVTRQSSLMKSRKSIINLTKSTKDPLDPYFYIFENRLAELRTNSLEISSHDEQYSYVGTAPQFNVKILHSAFLNSPLLQIAPSRFKQPGSQDFKFIKVAKIGILTPLESKNRRSSKGGPRSWGAVLTLSQIYFFRDTGWVRGLMDQLKASVELNEKNGDGTTTPFTFRSPIQGFHADQVMSTQDMIAIFDESFTEPKNSFAIISKNTESVTTQDWFTADSEMQMNDWIVRVNYAAALNTSRANLQGVEKSDSGHAKLQHFIGSLNPQQSRRQIASVSADTDPSMSGRAMSLFSSLFYGETSVTGQMSDENTIKFAEDETAVAFALTVSEARLQVLAAKICELENTLLSKTQELEVDRRTAKHLSILTPLVYKSRDSVALAVDKVNLKLETLWIDVTRVRCFREILVKEMDSEKEIIALLEDRLGELHREGVSPEDEKGVAAEENIDAKQLPAPTNVIDAAL